MKRALWPLVPVYGAAQALNSMAYTRGWRRTERLAWPVVSVGNLSVGGAGKTPFVIALARVLTERGWRVDVLSRGYGRASDEVVERVAVEPVDDPARRYGDEPWLIAQRAEVPVFVGRERTAAGRLAEAKLVDASGRPPVHLLDDGMQHRGLARDAEIVLVHRSDFETTLLPAGRLREPLAALERADFVVLREEDAAALAERARRWMRADAQLWTIRRELELPTLPGAAVVFSAIAHPEEFADALRAKGVVIAATHAWRDHHRFTDHDVRTLCDAARKHRARCFVTTEKDLVRLAAAQRAPLEQIAPLVTAKLTVRLVDTDLAMSTLEERLKRRIA
ncbi:MAG TPA: tetraacyldisaccharide 4'-kinase [Acidobacteriaceae bacterium]